ncbi:glycosyltransferase family 2 protein [Paractinoplanes rhizophilus]|uniref:Glycosyltransferase family 2 protein n=1 Tax=Paractinoplanes rhizophilus TaxID=1416877 RepID=A0ABW2HJ28_9ACTN
MSTITAAHGSEQAPHPIETDEVTIVVATRNRADRLAETVPRHRAPVIVVDNASDEPIDVPGADVIHLSRNLGAAARNVGVARAGTPFVAFADDDSYWENGALAGAAAILRAHPRVALLAAEVRVGAEGRLDPVSAAMAAAPLGTPEGAPGPAVLGFLSCAVVVRRDVFLAVGGFQPRLFVYGEEALLAMDLAAAGHLLSYVPSLRVRHLPEPSGRDPRARRRVEARNRLLTALLRRPPATVARTALDAGPVALAAALRHLPWALRHRRRVPPPVEASLRLVADAVGTTGTKAWR